MGCCTTQPSSHECFAASADVIRVFGSFASSARSRQQRSSGKLASLGISTSLDLCQAEQT